MCWSQALSSWWGNHQGHGRDRFVSLKLLGDGRYWMFWVMRKVAYSILSTDLTSPALRRLHSVISDFKVCWVRRGSSLESARESSRRRLLVDFWWSCSGIADRVPVIASCSTTSAMLLVTVGWRWKDDEDEIPEYTTWRSWRSARVTRGTRTFSALQTANAWDAHGLPWSTALQSEGILVKIGRWSCGRSRGQFENDWMQTYEVTDATETSSGTAKMYDHAKSVETTQAEAEAHFHSYFLDSGENHATPSRFGTEDSPNDTNSSLLTCQWQDIPLSMQTCRDCALSLTVSDVVFSHECRARTLCGAALLGIQLRHDSKRRATHWHAIWRSERDAQGDKMRCAPLHPHLSSQGHTQLECLDAFVVIDSVSAETERRDKLNVQGGCLRVQQTTALPGGSLNANHRERQTTSIRKNSLFDRGHFAKYGPSMGCERCHCGHCCERQPRSWCPNSAWPCWSVDRAKCKWNQKEAQDKPNATNPRPESARSSSPAENVDFQLSGDGQEGSWHSRKTAREKKLETQKYDGRQITTNGLTNPVRWQVSGATDEAESDTCAVIDQGHGRLPTQHVHLFVKEPATPCPREHKWRPFHNGWALVGKKLRTTFGNSSCHVIYRP